MDDNRKLVQYITDAIKLVRRKNNMTQAEIAYIAGVAPAVYRHTEVHRRELKLSEYLRIRTVLKLPDEQTLLKGFQQLNIDTPFDADALDTRNLKAGLAYTIGKFICLLDDETGDLRITVHTNCDNLKITPKSDNKIILSATK